MSDATDYTTVVSERPDSTGEGKRACLIMIRGDFLGQTYELDKSNVVIGRSDSCDIVLSDTRISRNHACIKRRSNGYYVEDLGSINGVLVNGNRVESPMKLYEGDKLRLDQVLFKFSYQDDEDAAYHLKMRNMAVKDDLTKIFNKRYFRETLSNEFSFARRSGSDLVLIIFDIDHFKQINDTLGHPAGDNVLKQLAALITERIRGYDLFARYGGEEFVFLFKGLPIEDSLALAQRVRKTVEDHIFEYDGEDIRVTVSLGLADLASGSDIASPADLLSVADKCLYDAKNSGRNKVCYPPG